MAVEGNLAAAELAPGDADAGSGITLSRQAAPAIEVAEEAAEGAAALLAPVTDVLGDVVGALVPPPGPADVRPSSAAAYTGLGAWVDAYDWSVTFGGSQPAVGVADIDRMADLGVQSLYVQASKWNSPTDVLEAKRLRSLIKRARERGLRVVAWYLPTLEDPGADLRRLVAIADFDVDAVAVDIEARNVTDVAERNRRLVQLSADVRSALPGVALGAVVFPPVVMEVINPSFWPNFPWAELAPFYDAWLPMAYQSFRSGSSPYRNADLYTAENIDRVLANLGRSDVPVHTIGGIADATSPGDVEGMVAACAPRGCVGGSLYDYRTTSDDLWSPLQAFRR